MFTERATYIGPISSLKSNTGNYIYVMHEADNKTTFYGFVETKQIESMNLVRGDYVVIKGEKSTQLPMSQSILDSIGMSKCIGSTWVNVIGAEIERYSDLNASKSSDELTLSVTLHFHVGQKMSDKDGRIIQIDKINGSGLDAKVKVLFLNKSMKTPKSHSRSTMTMRHLINTYSFCK